MLVGVPTIAQVEFNANDVEMLRQLQVSSMQGKPMTAKQIKQLETINQRVASTTKLPLNALDDEILIIYAERLLFNYQQYKNEEDNAKKFIWVMKRLYKNDPKVLDKFRNNWLSDEQKNAIINEIK